MRTTLFIFFLLLLLPDPDWIGENPLKFAAANLAFLVEARGVVTFLAGLFLLAATFLLLAVQPVRLPCLTAIRTRGFDFGDRIPLTTVSIPLFKARLPAFFSSGTADRNKPLTTWPNPYPLWYLAPANTGIPRPACWL